MQSENGRGSSAPGRLEHEELARDAGLERAALDPHERVRRRPPRRRRPRAAHDAARSASSSSRPAWRSWSATGSSARAPAIASTAARATASVVMHGHARDHGGLADRVAVAAGVPALRRVDDEVDAAAADELDDRVALLDALDRDARRARARPPSRSSRRGRSRAPASACATGTTATLSASRTLRNARPPVGSGRPAARSAFANAVAKSAPLAITSPVERISGPSTGSAPGKRTNGSTAAFTWWPAHTEPSGGSVELGERRARREPAGRVDEVDPGRLRRVRDRARGPRVDLEDVDLARRDRELDVQQPDDAERRARAGERARGSPASRTAPAARTTSRPSGCPASSTCSITAAT